MRRICTAILLLLVACGLLLAGGFDVPNRGKGAATFHANQDGTYTVKVEISTGPMTGRTLVFNARLKDVQTWRLEH